MEFLSSRLSDPVTLIIDSSILVACILQEDDAELFIAFLENAAPIRISSATLLETSIVLIRKSVESATEALDRLLSDLKVEIVPVSEQQARLAVDAYRRFGKGRHPAALNFGDCFSYALAKYLNEPLLFKGEDFRQTDILIA